uniref:Aldehyde dehydrogenase 16 family, member A1 n=1 Tax=Sinocyclocheilus grahami TaxID=75366 RepID=A0A672KGJ8_SINGR
TLFSQSHSIGSLRERPFSVSFSQSWLVKHSRVLGFFIDGKFFSPADRQTHDVTDSKAAVVCSTVCAKDEDVASAASSAAGAFKTWSELSCYQRAKVLLKLASVLQRHSQCFQWVLCVQESVLDSVVAKLKLRMTGMKCVPLATETDRNLIDAAVQEAQQQGATLMQSCPPASTGALYPPTVLCGLAPSCESVISPPPGPVLPLISFRSSAEGVTLGNHSPYGQAASIWTEDLTLALESAKSLCVGSVWVNCHSVMDPALPLCGRRESGNCTDGGREFLRPSHSPSFPRSSPSSINYADLGSAFNGELQSAYRFCVIKSTFFFKYKIVTELLCCYRWMKKSPTARSQSLYSLADSLDNRRQDLAVSIQTQTGISLEEAEKEVELSVSRLTDWAARCDKEQGGTPFPPQSGSALSTPEALGVLGVILPNSKPLLSLVSLLGPAVAMGNAVIMVPSEKYPLPALEFIQVLQASDIPGGLVSIITGGRDHPLKRLWLHCEEEEEREAGRNWTSSNPSLQEELWRKAVVWKSIWIPTA